MSRLIDGLKALIGYQKICEGVGCVDCPFCKSTILGGCKIEDYLKCQPTVEAEPVKHGKWKLVVEQVGNGYEVCSCCGYHHLVGDDKYCPHCGAKMDEAR